MTQEEQLKILQLLEKDPIFKNTFKNVWKFEGWCHDEGFPFETKFIIRCSNDQSEFRLYKTVGEMQYRMLTFFDSKHLTDFVSVVTRRN